MHMHMTWVMSQVSLAYFVYLGEAGLLLTHDW